MLFEDNPLSKSTRDPRDYRYLKVVRTSLKLIGAWPGRELNEGTTKFETAPIFLIMSFQSLCLYFAILYLREYSNTLSFFEIGHVYITVFMTILSLSRGFSLPLNPKYRKVMTKYLTKMHLFYHRDDSEIARQTHVKVHKRAHFLMVFLEIQFAAGLTLFNIIPIYNNYASGKFETKYLVNDSYDLSIYYNVPFDILTNLNGYIFISTFNWFVSYFCATFFIQFDYMLLLMIFTINGHFKILIYNLNNFPLPGFASDSQNISKSNDGIANAQLYNGTEMSDVTLRLKGCIDYHRELIEFTQEISEAFGPMLFVYYMFHQASGCLLLLECSQMDMATLIRYGPLTGVLFQQLILVSVYIETVATVTGLLKDAVYNVPWEYMNTHNRKIVAIFLMNVFEPVHINALGLAKVGVQSMAAILKTSFSYFAFLRTVSE